jgi:hypothetical protein
MPSVLFLANYPPYNAGQIAVFSAEKAAELCAMPTKALRQGVYENTFLAQLLTDADAARLVAESKKPKPKKPVVVVEFLRNNGQYKKGDTAAFPEATARRLVARSRARPMPVARELATEEVKAIKSKPKASHVAPKDGLVAEDAAKGSGHGKKTTDEKT